ncbi:carbon-nitrogen family hydrolase [Paenibacillus alkaliterrae]|uniref:carbon-nitrogen family hydrolase n=1 Tax=Paenibacillus alkaliterrae TaxID=320909 RepID=UPI001F370D48|nr:carbon-nitrogen family hydrolase [Paenibacillus alkaliterrae]MCF2937665.1 carbon-nitrogen family hydrolase [Paenibacillus alkaliterrae]
MKNKLRLALLQMHVEAGYPEANFAKLSTMLEDAVSAAEKPDVILFPEMWNTGYALTQIQTIADKEGERTKAFLSAFSKMHRVHIVGGSIAELREDKVFNTIYVFDREGNVTADYSKIHLFRLMDEEKYLAAGDKLGTLEIEGAKAGMMICYDIRFPELARKLALEGAKLLFVPAEWPHPRLHHWRTLLTARAIENQMFVIACNRMGSSGDAHFFGHSIVLDPWGEAIAEAGDEETIIYADIDLSLVDTVRSKIPVFEDRRPAIYEA